MFDFLHHVYFHPGFRRLILKQTLKPISKSRVSQNGFSLIEVLVAVLIIGIVVTAFQQVLSGFLSTHQYTKQASLLLNQGRFAMDRMVAVTRETAVIDHPAQGSSDEEYRVTERLLDMMNNINQKYVAAGDGVPDADNDSDGLTDNDPGANDDVELVTFGLDKSESGNWKLIETFPDYTTPAMDDSLPQRTLCEHVTQFTCTVLAANLVEFELSMADQGKTIYLKTRAVAGRIGS